MPRRCRIIMTNTMLLTVSLSGENSGNIFLGSTNHRGRKIPLLTCTRKSVLWFQVLARPKICLLFCNLPEPQDIFDALAPTTRYSGILMFVYNLDTIYCVFSLTGYHIYGIIQLFSGRGTAPETSRFSFPQSWLHGFI